MEEEKNYIDETGLTYLWGRIKALFVQKEAGKGLSTNDFTNEQKSKLDGLQNYTLPKAGTDTLGGIMVGAGLTIDGQGRLSATGGGEADSVNWDNVIGKPTKLSEFTNDSGFQTAENVESTLTSKGYQNSSQVEAAITSKGYQTSEQVQSAINSAVAGITGIDFQVVESLPGTGQKGTIYLVSNNGTGQNIYDEYIWLEEQSKFEKIGTTEVDLSGYLKSEDLVPITTQEIDDIIDSLA